MATYANAKQAKELVHDVAHANNHIVDLVAKLMNIRAKYLALDAAGQLAVDVAIADVGFDAAEIKAIIAKWVAVNATMTSQNVAKVEAP